ncbi:hypothetical protein [Tellurirhabdus rosea]|uniref:hypothetical protein n=1 Tax=Tellurirhabdus rosea TaxID=2674997 RepID=UPI0022508995|nr:hypothetical protein [Tellurirhabdus rosea]
MHAAVHRFHIPVMGLAFTIDTPIKVARFGINSVLSIVEDRLIESMRQYYYQQINEPYVPITPKEEDYRAKRVTDYLNLVNRTVQMQVDKLKSAAFEAGSDLVKYFEMLPDDSSLKQLYRKMQEAVDAYERDQLAAYLKLQIEPGSIDVNIMTKVDKANLDKAGSPLPDSSDAVASLRGYAKSDLTNSSLIFSAGLNPRLYNYLEKCPEFEAKGWGVFDKKVVIKVSDYRSALIQGKYLAKKGIWVSEFRIESGLNCGGHAFATDGYLMGPILEEFKAKKDELTETLAGLYNQTLLAKNKPVYDQPHPIALTVQGGIGTHEEAAFLHRHYGVVSTGWGTPFLLVPEATTVDDHTLEKLRNADSSQVVLSKASPLGVRFYYLKGTTSDGERQTRIRHHKPGSPCTEKHLVTNTEFTKEPICTASQQYQKLKIEQINALDMPEDERQKQLAAVYEKECLCIGLSNAAPNLYNVPFLNKLNAVTICPSPNIAYFSKVVSLKEMTDHIYGRTNLITDPNRPHVFINELWQYVRYLAEQRAELDPNDAKRANYLREFSENLLSGIQYYENLVTTHWTDAAEKATMLAELSEAEKAIQTNN